MFHLILAALVSVGSSESNRTSYDTLPLSQAQDTVILVKEAKLPKAPVSHSTSSRQTSRASPDLRVISLGGALTSGYRNDGLYREAQQWAYPNLLARQMGVPFEQPLFSKDKGNGTGYIHLSRTATGWNRKRVTNHMASVDGNEQLEAYTGKKLNNFAMPHFSRRMDHSSSLADRVQPFLNRLSAVSDGTGKQRLASWIGSIDLQSDVFLVEVGFDDLVQSLKTDGAGISQLHFETIDQTDEMRLIATLAERGQKGLLMTVPDVSKLPYFQQYCWEVLKKKPVSLTLYRSTSKAPVPFDPEMDLLLPGETAERIMDGRLTGAILLKDVEVLSADPYDNEMLVANPETFNTYKIRRAAAKYNLAVVDLHALYSKILSGTYVTDHGVKVNPAWPEGNFFSADGLYPTALGQAIIANECIRTMNAHYTMDIPLVDTRAIEN
jgi:hypothetical protein